MFEYLSKPPVKFEDDFNNIYNEFLDRQVTYKSIGKKEIDDLDALIKECNDHDVSFYAELDLASDRIVSKYSI